MMSMVILSVCGCKFFSQTPQNDDDPYVKNTQEMRGMMGETRHTKPENGIIYGGLSDEAKDIERSLSGIK